METDDALYRRYLDGDEDALGELMERHGTKLTLYLDGYLRDLHEAEDVMIEAFAYLIAKKPRIRDGGFRAYLYQSARHMALRLLRKKRARNCFSLDALTEEPEARELVLRWQAHLVKFSRSCDEEKLRRLADLYSWDNRFAEVLDSYGPGTAHFMGEAIEAYLETL